MSTHLPEADWKLFRSAREVALDRFCARILEESAALIADENRTYHERYGALHELLRERDRELARAFDAPRRSAAFLQLLQIDALGLLPDDHLARFTAETRDRIQGMRDL